MISLILKENDLAQYISKEFPEAKGDEANAIHKKNMFNAKRIITDSIKYHLIPHVSSLKTPKKIFDALSTLFEGRTSIER